MLDITSRTKPIFLAARLDDELMSICHKISVAPEREPRMALVKEAEAVVAKMRENAAQNFSGRPFIIENLKGLEGAIRELAEKPLAFKGDHVCPVCGDRPMVRPEFSKVCNRCLDGIDDYRARLDSEDGFGTCCI